jgi:hypothetical protein
MKVTARAGRTLARIVIVDQNQQCRIAPCTDCSAQLPVAAPLTTSLKAHAVSKQTIFDLNQRAHIYESTRRRCSFDGQLNPSV